MASLANLVAGLRARWHRAVGCLARRFGRPAAARRHLERSLALGGDAFAAYVELAALAFAAGDYARWRRLLDEARRAAPERFARLAEPALGETPRLAGTAIARATVGPGDGNAEGRMAAVGADGVDAVRCDDARDDDCASARERERFQRLGPIRRDEIAACDLDELSQRLSG